MISTQEYGRNWLRTAFPETEIRAVNLLPARGDDSRRIEVELRVAGIEGKTWSEISAPAARGSWDILPSIHSDSLPVLLPGYLQWLLEPAEADVMMAGLPRILLKVLEEGPQTFRTEQLEHLGEFFQAVL